MYFELRFLETLNPLCSGRWLGFSWRESELTGGGFWGVSDAVLYITEPLLSSPDTNILGDGFMYLQGSKTFVCCEPLSVVTDVKWKPEGPPGGEIRQASHFVVPKKLNRCHLD